MWESILLFLDTQTEQAPQPYGLFHIIFLLLSIGATVYLCLRHRNSDPRKAVFITAVLVALLEIYKQINFTFSVKETGIVADFQWYAFPWQFCSMPMYVGLLTGIFRKGKIHNALCAFLATYAVFAGLCVMAYPVQVFVPTVGINIQTMLCHGSMIPLGVWLLVSGHVKLEHKTILKALPVFGCAVLAAMAMNEIAYFTGLLETDTFNMFFISPHFCLILYIGGFTLAAYCMLLAAMGIGKLTKAKQTV